MASTACAAEFGGRWRPVGGDGAWTRFDPESGARLPRSATGIAIVLEPPRTGWPPGHVLEVRGLGFGTLALHRPDGSDLRLHPLDVDARAWRGHGRLGLPLERVDAHAPLELTLAPLRSLPPAPAFALVAADAFAARDAAWLAWASACFGVMLAMLVMALVFAVLLRDATFLWYALYLGGYLVIQLLETGYAAHPLHWRLLAEAPFAWGRPATLLSLVAATAFLIRFADLRERAPGMRRALQAYMLAVAAFGAAALLPFETVVRQLGLVVNLLLVAGGPLLLAAAVRAWRRGAATGAIFALGWTPLLVATALDSAQAFAGGAAQARLGDAVLGLAAFEALVFSDGLAVHAGAMRRQRDLARRLADTDGLTGLLTRRALLESLEALLAAAPAPGVAELFVDLDDFKRITDRFGHAAGDLALRRVADVLRASLRAADLAGRYGGEELVACIAATDAPGAEAVAERIRARVEALVLPAPNAAMHLTVSIGVGLAAPGEGAEALLARADSAMYAAKAGGRNRVQPMRTAGVSGPGLDTGRAASG
uniref:diguanylate cyclase n=1 Tax=Coralloluteibacterium stylophorae TaxID=1776034 RepID=A0A8J7VUW3_9GAMM